MLWPPEPDLLESGPDDRVFVVETDEQGVAHLRFGDGANGTAAPAGGRASPRAIGSAYGPDGNVGAETIVQIIRLAARSIPALMLLPRNPLAAAGGTAAGDAGGNPAVRARTRSASSSSGRSPPPTTRRWRPTMRAGWPSGARLVARTTRPATAAGAATATARRLEDEEPGRRRRCRISAACRSSGCRARGPSSPGPAAGTRRGSRSIRWAPTTAAGALRRDRRVSRALSPHRPRSRGRSRRSTCRSISASASASSRTGSAAMSRRRCSPSLGSGPAAGRHARPVPPGQSHLRPRRPCQPDHRRGAARCRACAEVQLTRLARFVPGTPPPTDTPDTFPPTAC